jgi:hypothetical protein
MPRFEAAVLSLPQGFCESRRQRVHAALRDENCPAKQTTVQRLADDFLKLFLWNRVLDRNVQHRSGGTRDAEPGAFLNVGFGD